MADETIRRWTTEHEQSMEGDPIEVAEIGTPVSVSNILYSLRDTAGRAVDRLRAEIEQAQRVLDALHAFADDAQDAAQLIAASDIEPTASALVPERSGLVRDPESSSSEVSDR